MQYSNPDFSDSNMQTLINMIYDLISCIGRWLLPPVPLRKPLPKKSVGEYQSLMGENIFCLSLESPYGIQRYSTKIWSHELKSILALKELTLIEENKCGHKYLKCKKLCVIKTLIGVQLHSALGAQENGEVIVNWVD